MNSLPNQSLIFGTQIFCLISVCVLWINKGYETGIKAFCHTNTIFTSNLLIVWAVSRYYRLEIQKKKTKKNKLCTGKL